MEPGKRRELFLDWAWFVTIGVMSSVWCLTAASQLGATFDEPVYLSLGLESWRTGSHSGLIRLGTMPLPIDVTTFPLYCYERWWGIPFDPASNFEELLPWARAATLIFWWTLLFYGRQIGRTLGGPWAGCLAVALLALEPSFLAHASLATTDIAVSACVLALVYHFRAGREGRWVLRVGLPAACLAAALLAKVSGVVFGIICLSVVEVERLVRAGAWNTPVRGNLRSRCSALLLPLRGFRIDLTQILILGMVLTFIYCGCDWRAQPSFVDWARGLPDDRFRPTMVWIAEHLRIFSNAGEGIVRQIKHNFQGHGAYLLGRTDPRAIWYYFPVVLSIKLSVPLLLLPVVVLIVRPQSLINWACLAAAALLLFSLTCRVQLGIRLMLPLVALAAAGLSASFAQSLAHTHAAWHRHLLRGGVTAGLLWTAASAMACWPHGLSYVNDFWGGVDNGYRVVSETNYDWGQGLPELARWQEQNGLPTLAVWYYGTDPAFKRLPFEEIPLHAFAYHDAEDIRAHLNGHYVAVSTTILYGNVIGPPAMDQAVAYLRSQRAMARTTTFFIYDFTHSPDPARPAIPGETFTAVGPHGCH